jgi:hypothetical protein
MKCLFWLALAQKDLSRTHKGTHPRLSALAQLAAALRGGILAIFLA